MRFLGLTQVLMVAAIVSCSRHRVAPVDPPPPLAPPVRVYVDYKGGVLNGESHAITQTAVLARIASLVSAPGGDWIDPYTQMLDVPIRQVRLEWTSERAPYGATVDIGSNWIGRKGLIQDIPFQRASEILELLRTTSAAATDATR